MEFQRGDHRHSVVIGMDAILLGPTPAVGMLTRSLRADISVMTAGNLTVKSAK